MFKKELKVFRSRKYSSNRLIILYFENLDPYRYKSSHLTMLVSTIKKCGMYLQIKVKILILS